LIGLLGLDWLATPSDVDEKLYLRGEPPLAALRVALAKAGSVATTDAVVLAADTVVALAGAVVGKPSDAADAVRMLRALRGRAHEVLTGVVVRSATGRDWGGVVSTGVVMRSYGDDEIDAYVKRGEPFDKAGAYAVQDDEFRPVERLDGCYLNVVGLPLCAVAAGLESVGQAIPNRPPSAVPPCEWCRRGASLVAIGQGSERGC
jgi:MAF protein